MKRPALFCALLAGAIAMWEIVTLWRVHADAPEPADWQTAAAMVRKGFRAGDLIVFAPGWVDPIGRTYLGDLLTIEDVARIDAAGYARVWELSIRGAAAPETAGRSPALEEQHGAVRVRRIDRQPRQVIWSTHDRARLLEVGFTPKLCVLLPPSRDPARPGRLDLGQVPLGAELRVYAGLADFRARKENWAYAVVRVLVDGQEVAAGSVGNDDGWLRVAEPATEPGGHQLVVEGWVDPTRGDPNRARLDLCVAAEALR